MKKVLPLLLLVFLASAASLTSQVANAQQVTCRKYGTTVNCSQGPVSNMEALGSILGTLGDIKREKQQRQAEAASRAAQDELARQGAEAEAARAALARQQLQMLKETRARMSGQGRVAGA